MKVNDKVTYNSISGPVKAKIVGVNKPSYRQADERLVLRSTSRTNGYYPTGYEWEVPAGSISVVLRP